MIRKAAFCHQDEDEGRREPAQCEHQVKRNVNTRLRVGEEASQMAYRT